MSIIPIPVQETKSTGALIGLYGETGVGKTVDVLKYVPGKMCYVKAENRNVNISIKTAGRNLTKHPVDVIQYDKFTVLKEYLEDMSNFEKYDTVVVDSISQLMNIHLSREIEEETFDSKSDDKKESKSLILSTKKEFEGWGALAGQMYRLITPLGRLSENGKLVICTFLHDSSPSWGRKHLNAPLVDGKKFGDNMGAFFDYIGWLEPRYDSDGSPVYPANVYFHGMPDIYCKWTGPLPAEVSLAIGPFDVLIKYIIKIMFGKYESPCDEDNNNAGGKEKKEDEVKKNK